MMTHIEPQAGDALLIVDLQNDFLPGGALAVPDGDAVVPVLNRHIGQFRDRGLPVFATRDWHPQDHCSFSELGGPWPLHCVSGTPGAEIAAELMLPEEAPIISKATTAGRDAYSGFDGTDLVERLRKAGVKRLLVGGLATDYCVLNTVLDALKEGFQVIVIQDAVRAVDVKAGDGDQALGRMQEHGAILAT